jgi:MEMO1 family protein
MKVTTLARQAIEQYLQTGKMLDVPADLPAGLSRRASVFVTLHQADGTLRGCIGAIVPTTPNLAAEVIANAVAAATRDPRFAPVQLAELPGLHLSVDVLTPPVVEPNPLLRLNPKQYGIIVATTDGRQGVLLPDLDNVSTVDEQIEICREKGGIGPDEPVQISKFQVERNEE